MKKILLAAILSAALAGNAQQTPGKLSFQKGQKLEMVTETKKSSSMELMGQAMESVITSTLTQVYDVESTDDAGAATIEHKVKRLLFNATGGMGGDQSFDSEKEGDLKGEMGKLLEKSLKNKYKMTVDPSGKISSVKADDDNPNAKKDEQSEAIAAMMSTQMGFNLGLPIEGSVASFKILPARELKLAEAWTDTSSGNGIKTTTNYKVANMQEDIIVLDYTEAVVTDTKQQLMGTEAAFHSVDDAVGQISVNKHTGMLVKKTATINTKGTVEAQGMTIPVSAKTSVTVTITPS